MLGKGSTIILIAISRAVVNLYKKHDNVFFDSRRFNSLFPKEVCYLKKLVLYYFNIF